MLSATEFRRQAWVAGRDYEHHVVSYDEINKNTIYTYFTPLEGNGGSKNTNIDSEVSIYGVRCLPSIHEFHSQRLASLTDGAKKDDEEESLKEERCSWAKATIYLYLEEVL